MKKATALWLQCGLVATLWVVPPAIAGSEAAGGKGASLARQPLLKIQQHTLKNGLKLIFVEDHHAPVYSLCVTYNTGSRDELPGKTGFAHLFEHMMFQGSENVGKAEHFVLISNNGGSMNGSTSFDRTNYFQTLPANQLELGIFLEADRMRSLDVSQENLDNQRQAVKEERRMRYDNRPYGTVFERIFGLTYDNFAYKHSTIGSMADLDAASLADVRSFFATYYAPINASLVLVGDFEPARALALIEKHFGNIPAQPAPTVPDLVERLGKGERRATWEDPLAPYPRVDWMFPTVAGSQPDSFALDVLMRILGGGEGSRLYQRMVKTDAIATSAGSFAFQVRGSGPVWIMAMGAPGVDPDRLEAVLTEEVVKVQSGDITEDELARAKTGVRAELVDVLETSMRTAVILGEMTAYFDDPNLINRSMDLVQAVTVDDLRRVAQRYLTLSNRGVLVTRPAPKNPPAGVPNPAAAQ